jgi:hypothetical protein
MQNATLTRPQSKFANRPTVLGIQSSARVTEQVPRSYVEELRAGGVAHWLLKQLEDRCVIDETT